MARVKGPVSSSTPRAASAPTVGRVNLFDTLPDELIAKVFEKVREDEAACVRRGEGTTYTQLSLVCQRFHRVNVTTENLINPTTGQKYKILTIPVKIDADRKNDEKKYPKADQTSQHNNFSIKAMKIITEVDPSLYKSFRKYYKCERFLGNTASYYSLLGYFFNLFSYELQGEDRSIPLDEKLKNLDSEKIPNISRKVLLLEKTRLLQRKGGMVRSRDKCLLLLIGAVSGLTLSILGAVYFHTILGAMAQIANNSHSLAVKILTLVGALFFVGIEGSFLIYFPLATVAASGTLLYWIMRLYKINQIINPLNKIST
jgi:hypothetical protein